MTFLRSLKRKLQDFKKVRDICLLGNSDLCIENGMVRDDTIVQPAEATTEDLLAVHTSSYINSLKVHR